MNGAARAAAAGALCIACLPVAARAQSAAIEWTGTLGLTHRLLHERSVAGGTLLTERGPMPGAQLRAQRALPGGGAIAASLLFAGGDLDYDGRTQLGQPLSTTTRQAEAAAELLWRPHAPRPWGEAWLTAGWLGNRRLILGTPTAGGLDETSSALLAGLRWHSPDVAPAAGWRAHAEADVRVSVLHRLHVDYHGLYDRSSFEGARKRQVALRLVAMPSASPWSIGLEWARLSQDRSEVVPVYQRGALYGTVWQPPLSIRDVTLQLSRRF
ncbi:MAG TPA: hypothetical protein VFE82_00955 [Ramlibacter sp.]|uniref:hypothetical protein n=1 Tax=Ramlibacter sp. TaxID=1917967 RepID=UPI002D3AE9F6|nr:hypothetical protein [Ramlibacter sp.]HZY17015.1 hypothetical protein [Ramlibacter sp.]